MRNESGRQHPQPRPAACPGQATGVQLGARHHYDVALDLWYGRKSPESEALDKAAADHLAALKSMLTPEREAALRNLETGKGSTLAIAKILQPAPHLLDMWHLPDTQPVRKVREFVQILNAPDEWNGFLDGYWTIGQTLLWDLTRDPEVVDEASNDSGRLGETWGQVKAAVLIDTLNLPREHVQDAADDLRRRCLDGRMTAIDGQNRPIPAIEWRHLKIVLDDENVPSLRVGQSTIVPAYSNVVFLRVDVLREFKPAEIDGDTQELAERRTRLADWFNRRQRRIPLEERCWLSLIEIAGQYARKAGSLAIDETEHEQIVEELRNSIVAGEFADKRGRSRVLNLHPSPVAESRFDPLSASHADLFRPIVEHLWIGHQDCVDWFIRHRLDLPHRLRRELSSTVLPEAARVDVEPRTLAKRVRPANKSFKEKEADALETAKTFVIDGVAPCVKEHATAVMRVLKRQHPQNHIRREDLERLLATQFKAQRRPQGNPRRTR